MMNFTRITTLACASLLAAALTACNSSNTKPDSTAAAPVAKPTYTGPAVTIASSVPFGSNSQASDAVRKECTLDTRLPEFIEAQAKEQGESMLRCCSQQVG